MFGTVEEGCLISKQETRLTYLSFFIPEIHLMFTMLMLPCLGLLGLITTIFNRGLPFSSRQIMEFSVENGAISNVEKNLNKNT